MTRGRPAGGLTLRAVGLALVLCALVVTLAVPLRSYLAQRSQIAALRAQVTTDRAAVADLQRRRAQWSDPAYVRAQARDRLHFVRPGETAYVVVGTPTPSPAPAAQPASRHAAGTGGTGPWWAQVWSTVVAAGAAAAPPAAAPAPTPPTRAVPHPAPATATRPAR